MKETLDPADKHPTIPGIGIRVPWLSLNLIELPDGYVRWKYI